MTELISPIAVHQGHELAVLPRFPDGALGGAWTPDRIGITLDADLAPVTPDDFEPDDTETWRWAGDVVGWTVLCRCGVDQSTPAVTVLGKFLRTGTAGTEVAGKKYAAPWLSDIVRLGERDDVSAAAHLPWDDHRAHADVMRELREAVDELKDAVAAEKRAQRRIDGLVGIARGRKIGWADIGSITGHTRQGASRRWADIDALGTPKE